MLGVCEIDKIKVFKKYNLFLIEDTAWGWRKICDEYLGTIGDIVIFSFDFAKP